MTTWGGREVQAFARAAGFDAVEAKRAACVAFAATSWRDHFESSIPGVPVLSAWGLWAINPTVAGLFNPRDLFSPYISAQVVRRLWREAGEVWDFHPIVRAFGGALIPAAWRAIEAANLWNTSAPTRQPLVGT